LTEERTRKDIAATNQLLEVIRGERTALNLETPDEDEHTIREPEPSLHFEKKTKKRHAFSLFSKRTIGLDVGSHTIKCVHVEKRGLNRVELVQADAVEVPPDARDPGAEDGATVRVRAIKQLMEGIPSHKAKIVTSVGGVSTAIRQVELPKMSGKELSSSINLWARNYIPFDVKEVQLDYQVFGFGAAFYNLFQFAQPLLP